MKNNKVQIFSYKKYIFQGYISNIIFKYSLKYERNIEYIIS